MPALAEAFESRETAASSTVHDTRTRFASAASWGAIMAGAAAAAAMSLILLILGTGLGLSAVSPWVQEGISAASFTAASIAWIGFASLVASGVGGYLAGRLRTRWLAVDPDEVYFRDTAHGFLTWAVATLLTAVLLSTVVAGMVGSGARVATAMGEGALNAGAMTLAVTDTGERQYVLDSLFRRNPVGGTESTQVPAAVVAETGRIVANALTFDAMPAEDLRHGAQLIARHTGLSEQAAATRLSAADTKLRAAALEAKQTADAARKASATVALWLFVTLLAGAFVASVAATLGGRQRDQS